MVLLPESWACMQIAPSTSKAKVKTLRIYPPFSLQIDNGVRVGDSSTAVTAELRSL